MKVERYNLQSLPIAPIKKNIPGKIIVSRRGVITLSYELREAMKLSPGDKIEFIKNLDAPSEYFIVKSDHAHAYEVRTNKKERILLLNNATLTAKLIFGITADEKINAITMLVSKEPVEIGKELLHSIITKSYKQFIKS